VIISICQQLYHFTGGSRAHGKNPSFAVMISPSQSPSPSPPNVQPPIQAMPPPAQTPTTRGGESQARRHLSFRPPSPTPSLQPDSPPSAPRGNSQHKL